MLDRAPHEVGADFETSDTEDAGRIRRRTLCILGCVLFAGSCVAARSNDMRAACFLLGIPLVSVFLIVVCLSEYVLLSNHQRGWREYLKVLVSAAMAAGLIGVSMGWTRSITWS